MKKLAALLFFTLSVALFSATLVTVEDKKGDDNGPGTYKYPLNKVFVPGAFDLLKFEIADDGDFYSFKFTIPVNFKDEWKNDRKWDVQMFDVYLNYDKGTHHQAIAGRNVMFKEGWDKVVLVAPVNNDTMMKREIEPKNTGVSDDESEPENLVADIVLPDEVTFEKNVLTAKVKKDKLPGMETIKLLQVFSLGSEGYPDKMHTYNRNTVKDAAEWRFSGGSDFDGDPNVIDILGDNSALKNYKATEEVIQYTTISLIDPTKKAAPAAKPAAVKPAAKPAAPAKK